MEFFKVCPLHFLLIVRVLLQSSVLGSKDCDFPAIFNFGDSNSDTGGFSALFGQAPPPYGETFFHAPAGRVSDGRLIIDFIAESLGLPYLSAFLDSVGSNFSHGANFAITGSTIRPQNFSLFSGGYSPISLNVQGVEYSDFMTRSQIVRKQGFFRHLLPEKDYFSRALYTFDIGQNDLTAGYNLNLTTEVVKAQVPDMIGQFSNVIKQIYSLGGRSFWIHNTAPLGCLTYIIDSRGPTTPDVDSYGCLIPYNELSQYFNLKLHEAVLQLRKELPLAAITYVDIYSVKYTLISQARKLGFEDPFQVCCGYGGKYNYNRFAICGYKSVVNGTEVVLAKSCRDPSVWINWDGVHFTEAANKWIFDQIVDGYFSDPPISLRCACNRCSISWSLKVCTLQFLLIAQILLQNSVLGSKNCNFPAIFNFGDSNSDTGGFSAAFVQAPPPNGDTFFHAPAGRYSDGRLLIDFIAEGLGLPYLSAFLDSVGSNFSHGANFATYASTIRPQNLSFSKGGYSPISLDVQHVEYSGFVTRSQLVREKGLFHNLLPEADYFSRALYTFDIGQNDLTAGLDLNLTIEEIKAQVPDMLGQYSDVIKKTYSLGGRYFWIHNTAPLGCFTYVIDALAATTPYVDRYGCLIPYNELSQYFNLKLHETVLQLRKELSLAAITYVDIYSAKYNLISQAKKLGFEDPFQVCCGYGGTYNYSRFARCGSKIDVNGTDVVLAKSCKDPSVWISWDGLHFTEAANKWIFDQIADGFFSDPPISLRSACNRSS